MKRTTLFLISILMILSIKAQTITVDGNNSDWAEVPILSEPGVFPYVKAFLTEQNVYYMLKVEDKTGDFTDNPPYDALRAYIDADRSTLTGQVSGWLHTHAGNDYDITTVISPWNGSSMYWSDQTIERQYGQTVAEAGFTKNQMLASYETGYEGDKIALADDFGLCISYKIGTNAETHLPANNWDFTYRNTYSVKPRTIVSEDVDGKMELTSSNAYYMPFMNDARIDDYLDFQSGEYPAQNPEHWASWAVNLTNDGKYNVNITHKSDDGGKIQFFLVDMATNQIVSETSEEIWYAKHDTDFTEQTLSVKLDFSSVTTGKYMLKIKNNTTWSTNLKIQKIVLENDSPVVNNQSIRTDKKMSVWNENNKLIVKTNTKSDIYIYTVSGIKVFFLEDTKSSETSLQPGVYIVKAIVDGQATSYKTTIK